jgi:hypothetical protein
MYTLLGKKMSVFQDLLKEEIKRLGELKEKYENEIESFPKGALSKKIRNGKPYLYLAFREKGKVKSEYIGKENSEKVQKIKELIVKRQDINQKLKQVKKELKELLKSVHE